MYKNHTKCRACQSDMVEVFSLGLQPLVNSFTTPISDQPGFAPLTILFCEHCTLSQLSVVVDPAVLYRDYKYVTSSSDIMRRHFDRLFKDIASEGGRDTICEIGSNDGLCLKFASLHGYERAVGVDPAVNLASVALNVNGVHTVPAFFDQQSAFCARDYIGRPPSVVLARHCLAHCDNWFEFVAGLEVLCDKDTLIALEFPYALDMISKAEVDQAYHEHLSFISLKSITALLKCTPFRIHRVIRYSIHGGSLLVMLRHKDAAIERHLSADEFLAEDCITIQHWERFSSTARMKVEKMGQSVRGLVQEGKRVCGFGASAKAGVWISACGFTDKELLFVSDNSPLKPGCNMAGTKIPVIHQEEFLSEHPDAAVMFCWNFRDEALKSMAKWTQRGGRFIIPTPEGIEIV